jgi:alpha-mannosidase
VVVTEHTFTNGFVSMAWNLDGDIVSIIDIRAARELLPVGRSLQFELAPDQPVEYDAWDVEEWTRVLGLPLGPARSVQIVDTGPLVATLRVERSFGASTLVEHVTMRAGSPRIDIALDIDWHEDEQLLSLMLPLDVTAREAACEIQFGHVMRPTHASNSWDAAKFEVCAHRWVDLSEPGFGVAVLNDGRYGHGVQDGGVRVSLLRAAKYPDPTQDHGRHHCTISVMPHAGGSEGLASVVREGERLNLPLRAVGRVASGADLPTAPLRLDAALEGSVQISAVKRADDGSGELVVRLYEALGARSQVTVRLPHRITHAARCNALEEELESLDTADGIVALTLTPFELVTLRLG